MGFFSYRRILRLTEGRSARAEVEDELAFHFRRTVEELEDRGLSREEAEAEALRRFGDLSRHTKTMTRIERRRRAMARTREWITGLSQGIAFALRGIRRSPGFAAAVVLTLALGIGANATMFGIVDRIFLRPPDHVEEPGEVKRLYLEREFLGTRRLGDQFTYADFRDFENASSFAAVAAWGDREMTWSPDGGRPSRVNAVLATWDFFPLLGVEARTGRFFAEEDDGLSSPLTAVVSHEYWNGPLGGDPDILGRTLKLDDLTFRVIGVAPPGFTGVSLEPVDVWLPLAATQEATSDSDFWRTGRGYWWLSAVARLAPGATVERAGEEATALHRQARADRIERGRYDPDVEVIPGSLIAARGPDASDESRVARWLTGVSLLVLLIACANVASLLLARIAERRREIAVRLALGISRSRLVALQISEALVLSLLGGGTALLLARWGGQVVRTVLLPQVRWAEGAVGSRVLLFTLAASVLAGLLAGVLPALQAREPNLTDALKEGSRSGSVRHSRLRFSLSVFQCAFSVVLLVGAGLFVRSLQEVHGVDLGLDADRVIMARLEAEGEVEDREWRRIHAQAARRLEHLEGVSHVAASEVPYQWSFAQGIRVTGWDSLPSMPGGGPYYSTVSRSYFRTLGLELLRGRSFREEDRPGSPGVVVVSETMARTLWPDDGALGKCIHRQSQDQGAPCFEVVGVVEDASRGGLVEEPFFHYYLSLEQMEAVEPRAVYIRAGGDPELLIPRVREELTAAFPRVRYVEARTLRQVLDPQARSWRLGATMFTLFGLLALVVAAMGLYSVLAFDVAQRTHELGVRSALGASRKVLVGMVLGSGVKLTALGVILGSLAALTAGRWVESLLFRVSATDPLVYGGVLGTLLLVGLLASAIPGMRATRVDPIEALKAE